MILRWLTKNFVLRTLEEGVGLPDYKLVRIRDQIIDID